MARYRVTVDTGGTFSDFVYLNEETGELSIAKLPSTPEDPSRAISAGFRKIPVPIIVPTTMAADAHAPSPRTKSGRFSFNFSSPSRAQGALIARL